MSYTEEQLYEKYKTLPKDIQGILLDNDLGPVITLLCKDVGVVADKALDVEDAVVNILLGQLHPKNFMQTITQKAELPNETVQKIAREVTESIFEQVEESLKKVHGINTSIEEAVLGSRSAKKEESTTSAEPTTYNLQTTNSEDAPSQNLPGSDASVPPAPQAPKPHDEPTSQYFASTPQKSRPNDEESVDDVEVPTSIFEEKLKKASGGDDGSSVEKTLEPQSNKTGNKTADPYHEPIE